MTDRIMAAIVSLVGMVAVVANGPMAQSAWNRGRRYGAEATPVLAYRIFFGVMGLALAIGGALGALGFLPFA